MIKRYLLAALLCCSSLAVAQSIKNSTVNCLSAYATPLGVLPGRRSMAIQTQYDLTPVFIGGSGRVVSIPGGLVNLSDGGTFVDGGPGVVGEQVVSGAYLSKSLPSTHATELWCIKATGAQDGTADAGYTVVTESP